ncbi:MAG TPA: hypothetical protein P5284_08260 [Candidatus Contendobacter sp.]|nr:hypothetical protein [Candidatus Contendobacter sp.]
MFFPFARDMAAYGAGKVRVSNFRPVGRPTNNELEMGRQFNGQQKNRVIQSTFPGKNIIFMPRYRIAQEQDSTKLNDP